LIGKAVLGAIGLEQDNGYSGQIQNNRLALHFFCRNLRRFYWRSCALQARIVIKQRIKFSSTEQASMVQSFMGTHAIYVWMYVSHPRRGCDANEETAILSTIRDVSSSLLIRIGISSPHVSGVR